MDQVIRISPYVIPGIRSFEVPQLRRYERDSGLILLMQICLIYETGMDELLSKTKTNRLVYVRQMFAYFMRKRHKKIRWIEIGGLLGNRDHTTAIHSIRIFQNRLDTNEYVPLHVKTKFKLVREDYENTATLLIS